MSRFRRSLLPRQPLHIFSLRNSQSGVKVCAWQNSKCEEKTSIYLTHFHQNEFFALFAAKPLDTRDCASANLKGEHL
ncbi:hypothetical protein JTE90_002705 [Oedothorax gibbosus]|uniref:Uncharacterized protein n=1 Tax=Oedothorax gibbosus TaxID=931172 RepID=A0AAV6VVP9_9ARAC|nr:hypothetical protein JTE90_002705 [Oedothorax gibbosus]